MAKTFREWNKMTPEERKKAGWKEAPKGYKWFLMGVVGIIVLIILITAIIPDPEPTPEELAAKHQADSIQKVMDAALERYPNMPIQNSFDGSVSQVQEYLWRTLNDANSYEAVQWFNLVNPDGTFYIRHKFRAANAFGGKMLQDWVFRLDSSGNVLSVKQ